MSIEVLISARGGSKGIKEKNITPVCGKPLIYWVLDALTKSDKITKITVATDSETIRETVLAYKSNKIKIYERLAENAQDTSPTIDLVLEYINKMPDDTKLMLVQATSPLLTTNDVDKFLENFKDCDSSFSCVEFSRICWDKNGAPIGHDLKHRKRRQEADNLLVENGAMYINSVKNIQESASLLSGKIKPFIMPQETFVEIDEPEDIIKTEQILKKRFTPDLKDFEIFLTDCDGVLTDGGMYYSEDGEALKKFNTTDGLGIAKLKKAGFYVAIVTGESTRFAKERAKKLGIDCYSGIDDKLSCIKEIVNKRNSDLSKVIYVGDDINDFEALKNVGFSACPANAAFENKSIVNYITKVTGGNGAIREIVDYLI